MIVLSITFRNTKTSAIEILLTGYWSGLTGCMQYLVASTAVGFLVVSHLWFSLPPLIYYSLSLRHVGISFSLGFCVFAFFVFFVAVLFYFGFLIFTICTVCSWYLVLIGHVMRNSGGWCHSLACSQVCWKALQFVVHISFSWNLIKHFNFLNSDSFYMVDTVEAKAYSEPSQLTLS